MRDKLERAFDWLMNQPIGTRLLIAYGTMTTAALLGIAIGKALR